MTAFQLWLIFGVPFFLTGLLYVAAAKSGGKRSVLLLVATCYFVVVVWGPIWLCIRYFSLEEAWYGIGVSVGFRILELAVFRVGKGFMAAWKRRT
jgi:hypothetical protein